MDPCTLFLLEDLSSSDDLDLEELLDDDLKQTAVICKKPRYCASFS
jgi:hypothetical protein